jgi:hypothetical protein
MTENPEVRYPWFGRPPAHQPRPAADEPTLRGKRVILSTPEGFIYDMRAVSERHLDSRGRDVIDIMTEQDYFRWMWTGESPRTEPWSAHLVWVDS